MTPKLYDQLVNRRATRQYFAGDVFLLRTEEGLLYGFSVLSDPEELLNPDEVRGVYKRLGEVFALRPLTYYPDTRAARELAATWVNHGFDIFLEDPSVDPGPDPPAPVFEFDPGGLEVCGVFLGRQDLGLAITPEEW